MNNDPERELIQKTVEEALTGISERVWPEGWKILGDLGFALVGVAEDLGGAGGSMADLGAVLSGVGYAGGSVPLVESSALAPWLLAAAGLEDVARRFIAEGDLVTVTVPTPQPSLLRLSPSAGGWELSGACQNVAWAPAAQQVVALAAADDGLRLAALPLDAAGVTISATENLAGEPRGHLTFERAHVPPDHVSGAVAPAHIEELVGRAGLSRSMAMCGVLRRAREMTVRYASDRVQFGRPLRAFQAVQQHLTDVEGWLRGAQIACHEAATSGDPFAIAAAVAWTTRAGREVARCAHQVHGAIGVTQELDLHRYTRRLLAWSCEYGNERFWTARAARLAGGNVPGAAWRS